MFKVLPCLRIKTTAPPPPKQKNGLIYEWLNMFLVYIEVRTGIGTFITTLAMSWTKQKKTVPYMYIRCCGNMNSDREADSLPGRNRCPSPVFHKVFKQYKRPVCRLRYLIKGRRSVTRPDLRRVKTRVYIPEITF